MALKDRFRLFGGKAQEEAGKATGDTSTQGKGIINQIRGRLNIAFRSAFGKGTRTN